MGSGKWMKFVLAGTHVGSFAYNCWDLRLVDAELSGQTSFDLSRFLCSGARSVDSLSLSGQSVLSGRVDPWNLCKGSVTG